MLPTRDEFKHQYGDQPGESLDLLDAVRQLPARDCVLACVGAIDRALCDLFPPDDSRRGLPDGMLQEVATLRAIESHFRHDRQATFAAPGLPALPLPAATQRPVEKRDRFIVASILLHARLIALIHLAGDGP
jgi:hypothetical protein